MNDTPGFMTIRAESEHADAVEEVVPLPDVTNVQTIKKSLRMRYPGNPRGERITITLTFDPPLITELSIRGEPA